MQAKSFEFFKSLSLFQNLITRLGLNRAGHAHLDGESPEARTLRLDLLRHELRTPLVGVMGMCELLQKCGVSGEQQLIVSALQESGRQLLSLIAGMDLNQSASLYCRPVQKEQFNGHQFMEQLVRAHWQTARSQGIELYLVMDHRLPVCWFSEVSSLRQVLDNLLANAIKFTQSGYVLIEVELPSHQGQGLRAVHFRVRDTGIGVDAHASSKIYTVREQGGVEIPRYFGGSGLGLFICKSIATRLGAHLCHSSERDGGTCFRFDLPGIADPDSARYSRLQPRLLGGLALQLHLPSPLLDVFEQALHGMGVRTTASHTDFDCLIPTRVDAVICDHSLLVSEPDGWLGNTSRNTAGATISLFFPAWASGSTGQQFGANISTVNLTGPFLRSRLEPVLLRLALQKKCRDEVAWS